MVTEVESVPDCEWESVALVSWTTTQEENPSRPDPLEGLRLENARRMKGNNRRCQPEIVPQTGQFRSSNIESVFA